MRAFEFLIIAITDAISTRNNQPLTLFDYHRPTILEINLRLVFKLEMFLIQGWIFFPKRPLWKGSDFSTSPSAIENPLERNLWQQTLLFMQKNERW